MKGDSIILVMFSALLGVLIAFGIAYLIERIREAQGESAEEYEENFMPARKRRSEKLSELRYAAAVLRDRLQLEDTRLLFQIDEAAEVIEKLSAGKIYSPSGARAV